MERARFGDIELDYEVRGEGEPVIFIHGAFIADAFRPLVIEPVLGRGYRLISYRHRGYGTSRQSAPMPCSVPENWPRMAGRCSACTSSAASGCFRRIKRPEPEQFEEVTPE